MNFRPIKIGKYLLLDRIATGGMAEVYRAKASGAGGFEKQLAIKRIIPSYSQNEEFVRMFEYEARLSSLLNHANIVQVYDFVKSSDTYLLALEFVDGKNLRQIVNKAKKIKAELPLEACLYILNEVCKGLDYAHKLKDGYYGKRLNIIHRDMSPQNIMISYDGAVKIVDFGIAKARDRVDETRSGVIKGKFGYMSPEQASGKSIDHRSDIFSTTIILFELLTNQRLFAADNDMATLRRIQDCIVQRPSLINPKVTSQLEKIILKGLTKEPALRYQEAGELHEKLQEYLNRHHPSYTQKELSKTLKQLFKEEIAQETERLEKVYTQSIPFSQGENLESMDALKGVEEALDDSMTLSEFDAHSLITHATDSHNIHESTQSGDTEDQTDHSMKKESTQSDSTIIGQPPVAPGDATQHSQPSVRPLPTQEKKPPQKKDSFDLNPISLNPSEKNILEAIHSPKEEEALPNIQSTQPEASLKEISSPQTEMKTQVQTKKPHIPELKPAPPPPQKSLTDIAEAERAVKEQAKTVQIKDYFARLYKKGPPKQNNKKRHSTLQMALGVLVICGTYLWFNLSRNTTPDREVTNMNKEQAFSQKSNQVCPITIDSQPQKAGVYINNKFAGSTPMVLSLGCGENYQIDIKKKGYRKVTRSINELKQNQSIFSILTK